MNKLTKRIMALMLSLVMMLGCIPSNIAHAESDGLEFTFGKNSYVLNEKVPTEDCIVSENAESVIASITPHVYKIDGNSYVTVETENFEESGVYCFMVEVQFNNIEELSNNLDMYSFSFNEETLYLEDSMPSASSITKSTRAYIFDGNIKMFYGFEVTEKSATITLPITAGTTVDQIRNRATLTDTTNTANFNIITETGKRNIRICGLKENGTPNMSDKKDDTYALEADTKYAAIIQLKDDQAKAYETVNVNNKVLNFDITVSDGFITLPRTEENNEVQILYYFTAEPAPVSSSSKKYKAIDSKDSAEKVSGSGKKGSTRTIVPQEGKKVASVVVTDKDGNKIDVTLNEDGTYSFKQPASNVNIEVTYKNREITLTIGSTKAICDGKKTNLDVCPVVRNDRTMLPIRYIAENLGAKVEWSEKNPNYVVITRGDTKIEITLGSDKMLVNGKDVKLDSVAFAENDRTYLPVRAVSEALNALVEWNESEPSIVRIFERQ